MKSNLEEKKIKIEKTTENDDDDVDNPDEIEIEDSDEDEKKDVKVKDEENYEARDFVDNLFSRRNSNGTRLWDLRTPSPSIFSMCFILRNLTDFFKNGT